MPRSLFLSHSGIDSEAARALKARLLAAPAAQEHGLSVWFDKDDLRAGEPWQRQIEEAIATSDAFAVYVGSNGVVNWVEAEVRLALERAMPTDSRYPFIPILARDAPGPDTLPGFARQFQAVSDVEAQTAEFDKLMRAVLGGADAGTLQLEAEPFFGLRAIDESRSHLFFGRETETEELVSLVHRMPLVLVSGDSGSGKSSLVRAGLVPRFRGGSLALLDGERPEDTIWHVVTMQPRNQPFRELGDAVDTAAKGLGRSLSDRGTLAQWAAGGEPDMVRRALRCDLPADRTRVLLVVDQFEELLTIAPVEQRAPFIDLLLDLADPTDDRHRVVLTMRHDYVNLCSTFEPLKARLDAHERRARYQLRRMSSEGLGRVVTEPLRLAAIETADRERLAEEVLRDVGERPGDLALVQMALSEAWYERAQTKNDLLRAYADVGRVEGALAQAAEHVRTKVLDDEERSQLDSVLPRLVRLGDTGGATRRIASRGEFDEPRWNLVQKLASTEGKRLILLGGNPDRPTVEIAHETLVTAWPHFQNLLQANAEDKRVLDALIPRAHAWASESDDFERNKRLATGADLERFSALLDRQQEWLSDDEHDYIEASLKAEDDRRERDRKMAEALRAERDRARSNARLAVAASVVFLAAATAAGYFFVESQAQTQVALANEMRANTEAERARANETRALAALSATAFTENRYGDGVKLAVAAWPSDADDDRPRLKVAIESLGENIQFQRQTLPPLRHEQSVSGAAFNRDETRILTWSEDDTARLWDAATGEQVLPSLRHENDVRGGAFNRDETRIVTWSVDNTARLWDAATGDEVLPPLSHEDQVSGAAFNRDGTRILTWSHDNTARLWDAATGDEVLPPLSHEDQVSGAAFNRDGTRILTWSRDNTARLWDAATGDEILPLLRHERWVQGAAFNRDETRVLTWAGDNTARLWDVATGDQVLPPLRHDYWAHNERGGRPPPRLEHWVEGGAFNRDGTRILTWSNDNTARLWDAATGEEVLPPLRHEDDVQGAAFNRDETRILTWSRDNTTRLWDAATGEEVLPPLRHEDQVSGAAFNRDGTRILTWSDDNTARLWDAATGEQMLTSLHHTNSVEGAAFNRDGNRILTWSRDNAARLWDVATGEEVLPTLRHEESVWGAAFNRDETRILTWSVDSTARLWDAATGEQVLPPLRHESYVSGAAFNRDETRILTWSADDTARLWDAATGEQVLPPLRHEDALYGVKGADFNHDETRIITWSWDNTARLWDAATGDQVLPPLRHESHVSGAAFNRDETRILTWSWDNTARLWDAATGEQVLPPLRHEISLAGVEGAAFNRDETRILTWSGDSTVRLWDVATGDEVLPTLRHEESVWGAAFNRDETRILTRSGDSTVRLWDAATGQQVLPTLRHEDEVWGAAFNRDETRILTWSRDNAARLWDAATGDQVLPPLRHERFVWGAAFNRNETRILTWSDDSTVRLWDAATGQQVLTPLRHEGSVGGAAFNRDETRILTWSDDNTARLWDTSRVADGSLVEVACRLLPDHDTSELKDRYGIEISDEICKPGAPTPVWTELED